MSKTLLQACQSVATELSLPSPAAVMSASDLQAKQLAAFAITTGRELMQDVEWPHLRKLATIATSNGTTAYTITYTTSTGLTYSCDRIVDETGWDSTNQWHFVGNIPDAMWNEYLYGIGSAPIRKIFRTIDKNQIEVLPVPTATADTLVVSFITDCWALKADGTPQTTFLRDDDTHTFDDGLFELGVKWRFLRANGLAYDEEFDRFDKRLNLRKGQVRPATTLFLARRNRRLRLLNYGNVPETGYGP